MRAQEYIASFDAKAKFSHIIAEVEKYNKEYIVTRRGVPAALIIPYRAKDLNQIQTNIGKFLSYLVMRGRRVSSNGGDLREKAGTILEDKRKTVK